MPFAPFVGVNHHGQSILLGCGLLSSEDSESFTWLFKAWLTCMHGRAPRAIITDQCRSMAIAIESVFPNTHHRYCLWHIMKKLPVKFAAHANYKNIKKELKNIVYNSITIPQFEVDWMRMIMHFKLEDNDWLKSLYLERCKWIPVYVKRYFWAGMSTSQRSESMNAFFDDFVHSKTSLKQFVEQYDKALRKNIEKEKKLDFQSYNSQIPVVSGYALERQFQKIYTNDIFRKFQSEVTGLMFCDISLVEDNLTTSIYLVVENILGPNGEHVRDVVYRVHYTPVGCSIKCECQMFEFRGVLCRHVLFALKRNRVNEVPQHYIMERWRKDLKRVYQTINNIYDSDLGEDERNRFNYLTPRVLEVQQLACLSAENCSVFDELLKDVKERFLEAPIQAEATTTYTPQSAEREKLIHSPVKVRARGRPPTKRKQGTIEKVMNRSASRAAKKAQTARAPSNVEEQPICREDPGSFTALLSSQLSIISYADYGEDSTLGDNVLRR